MQRALWLFLIVVVVGVVSSTIAYRTFQVDPDQRRGFENRANNILLKDADKKLIETRESMSKWLLGLAFALLPGLVLTKANDSTQVAETRTLPMVAAALLVISIYGSFLVQDSIIFVLSRGPLEHLYGPVSELPLLLQFWSFLLALVVLIIFWFKPETKVIWPTLLVVFFLSIPASDAIADPAIDQAMTACLRDWSADRKMPLSAEQLATAGKVIRGIAVRSQVVIPSGCSYTNAMMDQLRLRGFLVDLRDSSASLAAVLSRTDADLTKPPLSMGEVLKAMLETSALHRSPSGLMRIDSKVAGSTIMINSRRAGFTNLELRLAPGDYAVEVVRDGKVIVRYQALIKDGEPWTRSVD